MRWMRILALASVATVLAAPEVGAQIGLEVTPFGAATFFLADVPDPFALDQTTGAPLVVEGGSFDHAWTVGANVGITMGDRWAAEGLIARVSTNLTATSGIDGNEPVNGYFYSVTGVFYLAPRDLVSPFLGVGVGAKTFDYDMPGLKSDTSVRGNVVGGLFFAFTESVGMRFEARDWFARLKSGVASDTDRWENDLMMSVGLSFRTGGGS